jgi:hypothetical protein
MEQVTRVLRSLYGLQHRCGAPGKGELHRLAGTNRDDPQHRSTMPTWT